LGEVEVLREDFWEVEGDIRGGMAGKSRERSYGARM